MNESDAASRAHESESAVATLARGASVAIVGKLLGRGVHILGQLVVARLLGPSTFGLYGTGWTILTMGGVFSTAGLDQAAVRFGSHQKSSDPRSMRGTLVQCIGLAIGLGLTVGL